MGSLRIVADGPFLVCCLRPLSKRPESDSRPLKVSTNLRTIGAKHAKRLALCY
jgi:hypothetical protein